MPSFKRFRIELYVLSAVLKPFLGSLFFFLGVFLMFQCLRLAHFLIEHHASIGEVAQISGSLVLSLSPFVIPVAFLAGIVVGLSDLSSENEIVAMKSCGFGYTKIIIPTIFLAICVSSLTLALSYYWAPAAERKMNRTLVKIGYSGAVAQIKEKTFNNQFFDLLLYADQVNSETRELHGVFLYDGREADFPVVISAENGTLIPMTSPKGVIAQVVMKLRDGRLFRKNHADQSTQVMQFKDYSIFLKRNPGGDGEVLQNRMLVLPELIEELRKNKADSGPYRDYLTEIWKRFATSIAPLIFCFLGIGLGTFSARTRVIQDKSWGFLVTFVTMAIYWPALMFGIQKGASGEIAAVLATQIPNLIVGSISIGIFRKSLW